MEIIYTYWLLHPIIISYLVAINTGVLFMFAVDKISARADAWRIREKTLLLLSLIGGSLGALAAIHLFRHKSRKISFLIWLWLILILQILFLIFLFGVPVNSYI